MVVPYNHTADLSRPAPETLSEMMLAAQQMISTLGEEYHPQASTWASTSAWWRARA